MAQEGCPSRAVMVSATPLPQAAGGTLHWDGRSGVCREVGSLKGSGPGQRSSFQAQGLPATGDGAKPYWTMGAIVLVPCLSPQAIVWDQEAALVTFDLDPVILAETTHEAIPRATGELVCVSWQESAASCTLAVHPVLIIHGPYDAREVERVIMVPSLPAHDPLLQHLALVLQATIEGEGVAGRLYAESLIDALVVHFLKRYAAARPSLQEVTGGLSPYKLRRTTAYIQAHLVQELSLATRAAVAQTSPAHFARLFKHAHRAGAPPVRDPVPDGARQAAIGRDRRVTDRHRSPGGVCRPKSLHRALSDARRPDPQSLPRPHQARMSGDAGGTSFSTWMIVARFQHG